MLFIIIKFLFTDFAALIHGAVHTNLFPVSYTHLDVYKRQIQKYDLSIAKNYLSKEELQALERIVTMYLDYAEYQASRHILMTMQDWSQRPVPSTHLDV